MSSAKIIRWAVNIRFWKPSDEILQSFLNILPNVEKDRILRFRLYNDRLLTLIGQFMIRACLFAEYGIQWDDIRIVRSEAGKPLLDPDSHIKFNISHHGNWIVLAATDVGDVGIDTTTIELPHYYITEDDFIHEFHSQLTLYEQSIINSFSTPLTRLQKFYEHWCIKESYLKAIGVGLEREMKEIEIRGIGDISNTQKIHTDINVQPNLISIPYWHMELTYLDPTSPVALCICTPDLRSIDPRGFRVLQVEEVLDICLKEAQRDN